MEKQIVEKDKHAARDCAHDHGEAHSHDHGHSHSHGAERGEAFERAELITMIVGAVLFTAGLFAGTDAMLGKSLLIAALLPLGWNLVLGAFTNIKRGEIFDENLLMLIAAVGAVAIGELPEAGAVLLFYRVGEWLQERAEGSSRRSITALTNIRPDKANLLLNGEITVVAPRDVALDATIVVKPGERIPLDGVVISGISTLDTSALTGESVPREVEIGAEVLSGCVNLTGALTIRVTKPYGESTVEKILALVEDASSRKAPTEQFITRFARVYTPAVVALAAAIAVIPLFFGVEFAVSLKRALILLVISCPCALVMSVPLAFFGGIGAASRRGILVKGGNYLDALCSVQAVAFDKTGTLTRGEFQVAGVFPQPGFDADSLLCTAAAAESMSTHPIAKAIADAVPPSDRITAENYRELVGLGVAATVDGAEVLAGNARLLREHGVAVEVDVNADAATVIVAVDGALAGYIVVTDTLRSDARSAVSALNARGVRTVMLTGDNARTAAAVADALGISEYRAELMPADKVAVVESLAAEQKSGGKVCFLGDGINDAPVLARADIGVAMGGLGSDAALEAADIVLMTDEPSRFCDAMEIARFTRTVVMQNIVLSLGVKLAVMVLGVGGVAGMWAAVFADVGVALLAVLNSARVIRKFRK